MCFTKIRDINVSEKIKDINVSQKLETLNVFFLKIKDIKCCKKNQRY